MGAIEFQITSLTIVSSTVYSDADQRKHQSSASLAFVWGSHRGPVNSSQKWPVTRKMFPFDDVIIYNMGIQKNQIGSLYLLGWISNTHAISVPGKDFVHFMYWLKLDWESHFVCLGIATQCNESAYVAHGRINMRSYPINFLKIIGFQSEDVSVHALFVSPKCLPYSQIHHCESRHRVSMSGLVSSAECN